MHRRRDRAGRRHLVRAGAVAGVVGVVAFVAVVGGAGLAQPELPLVASFVSELGADGSPTAAWVNGAFAAIGVLLAVFGAGLLVAGGVAGPPATRTTARAAGRAARLAGALVVAAGVGFVVMGASPCSPGCPIAVVDAAATRSDAIHNAAAIVGLVGVSLAALELAGDPGGIGGPGFRRWSGRAGVAIGGLSALFGAAVLTRSRLAIGVSERVLLLVALAWVALAAIALWREPG